MLQAQLAQRPHAVATPRLAWRSASERAPKATALRISRSVMPLQRQTYMAAEERNKNRSHYAAGKPRAQGGA